MENDPKLRQAWSVAKTRLSFRDYLDKKFHDAGTVAKIVDVFGQMGLPLPDKNGEFLEGTQGAIVFVNKYGVAIRIEHAEMDEEDDGLTASSVPFDRIDDSPWILRPLGSIAAGKAIVEICPGCKPDGIGTTQDMLARKLYRSGINFWDRSPANIGRVPVKTPEFPCGVPVVIDRLAVQHLSTEANKALQALRRASGIARRDRGQAAEAQRLQDELYAPLREAFAQAWGDTGKMKTFWRRCEEASRAGKLVAGWNDKIKKTEKQVLAQDAAWEYQQRMMSAEGRKITPPGPGFPR